MKGRNPLQATDSKETTNTPLYTDEELQEIYKKQKGDE